MRLRPRLALLAMLAVAAPFLRAPAMPALAQEAAAEMPPMPRPRPDPDSLPPTPAPAPQPSATPATEAIPVLLPMLTDTEFEVRDMTTNVLFHYAPELHTNAPAD